MKLLSRVTICAALLSAVSVMTSGVAAAQAERVEGVKIVSADVVKAEFGILGSYIEDCYYSGGYRGCSYFYGNNSPEVFAVCDQMADGRYTKGRIKFGGQVYELGPIDRQDYCLVWEVDILESVHVGIHTGVEGLGWTEYEYGYA